MPPTSHRRVLASLVVVLLLAAAASFIQALAMGLLFSTEAFNILATATDITSRWLAFAITAYVGAGIARERYSVVAFAGSAFALLFCTAIMYTDKQPTTIYNYVSLLVLVSAIFIGSLARKHTIRASSGT